jgi:uncharacterized caspase-like protein/Flp pilus assembly protein TadD
MNFKSSLAIATSIASLGILFPLSLNVHAQTPEPARQLQQLDPVKTFPGKAKRWALVIGVDKYSDPQISQLKGADNDARILSDSLVRYAGFPQDQVILLATDQPIERQPTRVNILRRLSNLSTAVPKDGLLLISFAGHGMERGGQAFLLPSDSQISDQISFLEDTAISVNRIRDQIKQIGVSQVVVLLDACRNDPGGRADAPNPLTNAYTNAFNFDVRNHEVQAFATIYATGIGQRAYEYTEKKEGYFSWAVVEGLRGGAANDKGEITLAQLVKYVQETVPKRIAIDLGSTKQQRPFAVIEGYRADELVVAVTNSTSMAANNPTPNIASVDPAAIELSFWDSIKNSSSAEDFRAYLDKYPDGQFASLAKNKINSLGAPARSESRPGGDATEIAFWDSIKNSSNVDDFRAYLRKYPNGVFSELAANRVKSLEPSTGTTGNESGASSTAGIGVSFQIENNQIMIKTVTDGGPAARAGLKAGDQITRINDQSVANISQTDLVGRIRGTPGTQVTVTYLPTGATDARTITLTRETLPEAMLRSEQGARLLEQQKCVEAEAAYASAVRLAPQEPSYHAGVGDAFACQNKLPEAESEFREAIRLGSRSPEIAQANFHGRLALLLWRTRDRSAEAEGELRRTIALAPTEAYWHAALSSFLLNANKMAEAETEAREAIRSNAKQAWGHETLGIILWRKKDFSGSETELREAIRLVPKYARSYFDLARLFSEQKRWTEAEEAIRNATRLEPGNQEYQAELQNVLKRKH